MAWKVNQLWERVRDYLVPDDDTEWSPHEERDGILSSVEEARREWLAAKTYFDNVTDSDLIDHAIYMIEASERKYMFLLKRAFALGYAVAPAKGGELQPPSEWVEVPAGQPQSTP